MNTSKKNQTHSTGSGQDLNAPATAGQRSEAKSAAPEHEPWEVNQTLLLLTAAGVIHAVKEIQRDYSGDPLPYSAQLICGRSVASFHSVQKSSWFYVRRTLKQRFCRKCAYALDQEEGHRSFARFMGETPTTLRPVKKKKKSCA